MSLIPLSQAETEIAAYRTASKTIKNPTLYATVSAADLAALVKAGEGARLYLAHDAAGRMTVLITADEGSDIGAIKAPAMTALGAPNVEVVSPIVWPPVG